MPHFPSMTSLDQLDKVNQYGGNGEGSLGAVENENDYKKPKLPQVSSAQAAESQPCPIAENLEAFNLFDLPSCNHAVGLPCNPGLGQLDRRSIPG